MAQYSVRAKTTCCILFNGVMYDACREYSFSLTEKEIDLLKPNLEIISQSPIGQNNSTVNEIETLFATNNEETNTVVKRGRKPKVKENE